MAWAGLLVGAHANATEPEPGIPDIFIEYRTQLLTVPAGVQPWVSGPEVLPMCNQATNLVGGPDGLGVFYMDQPPTVAYEEYPTVGDRTYSGVCYMAWKLVGTLYAVRVVYFHRISSCPANSTHLYAATRCTCQTGFVAKNNACVKTPPRELPKMCRAGDTAGFMAGNPIVPMTGEKVETVTDFADLGPSPLMLQRSYRSSLGLNPDRSDSGFGRAWTLKGGASLTRSSLVSPEEVTIEFSAGHVRTFQANGTGGWSDSRNASSTLIQTAGGGWSYKSGDDDDTLNFNAAGRLLSTVPPNGWATTYTYNASGQLATIANVFGRVLTFSYDGNGQAASVTTPDARVINYSYDATKRLASVTYPDAKSVGYLYENSAFRYALTGITDEAGLRFATFAYDGAGNAISTEHAGGVNRYQVVRNATDGVVVNATVIDPLGTSRNYGYEPYSSKPIVSTSSLPSGNGAPSYAKREQSVAGSVLSEYETDFKGRLASRTTWDQSRSLPMVIDRDLYADEPQTVKNVWHPSFRLPLSVTEVGRSTNYSYDALGNVLSKVITDRVTRKERTWEWTYNAQQLVATSKEPNGAVTTYAYDTRGNMLTSTNALGHVTIYTYDNANRVATITEPNGLVTTYTHDARDRLLTQTTGGQTTTITYKPYGTVETITLPVGLVLTYAYDTAHRQIGWSNNRGESGTYTLDGMGNRTGEQIKDSAGQVAWTVARTINNINRLSKQTAGPNQIQTLGYDSNGDLNSESNGLNQATSYELDVLRRVTRITNAAGDGAAIQYNPLNAATTAWDFKNVATNYKRDAQGNATTEASADIGSASTQYDSLGLPSQITDALGQATSITRDLLGRPTSLAFADGKTATLRYDLTANSKGYLSEIVDRSGTTEYTRDAFARVTLKKQTLINGSVQQVSYGYNANGTLASIGYPNGATLTHVYDATGRLAGLNWNGSPLVTGVAWNPLGQPTAWTWAFANPAVAASRVYDTAGRLTTTEFSSYVYDAAGRITSLTQNLYQPGDTDPAHSTISLAPQAWSVGYNNVGRIVSFNATGNTADFGYDANGNRSSSTRAVNGLSTSRAYTVGASSNQLTGFTQSINGASNTSVTYGYNANGDMVSDGLRSYTYDAEGRLGASTTGATDVSPTTRYAHNALGQRVFKTEPLYPPSQGNAADPGFMQSLIAFFTKLWSPSTTQAEQLGYAYTYDEQGTLIAEAGSGGTNSAGQAQYIYLPTANGPMPIAAIVNGNTFAVHSDHLNTPRKLTNADGQAVWQWSYSAFGEDKPTLAKNRFANLEVTSNPGSTSLSEVKFNLRYPGQYADEESGLFYNGHRIYSPNTGRYTQGDPIGLDGGWNRFGYVGGNPLSFTDPFGLFAVIERGFPREEEALRAHGRNLQALINKMCPEAKKVLQPIFDRWNVEVDPKSQDLRRNRSDYALTDFDNKFTTFYSAFNGLGPNIRTGGRPSQSFVFRHEFRHLMQENRDLYDRNAYLRDAVQDKLGDNPVEKDADDFARKLIEEYCPCK